MTSRPPSRWRAFVAVFCLFTVALLYAPLGGAAWYIYSRACCATESQCPIHGNHGSHSPATAEHSMDCGHDMLAVRQCRMDCCHHADRPALVPMIFVLPTPVSLASAMGFEGLAPASALQNTLSSIEPASPPPRISPVAA